MKRLLTFYRHENDDDKLYFGQFELIGEGQVQRIGRGISIDYDGSLYEGFWHDDLKSGFGRILSAENGKAYMGNFFNGEPNGRGKIHRLLIYTIVSLSLEYILKLFTPYLIICLGTAEVSKWSNIPKEDRHVKNCTFVHGIANGQGEMLWKNGTRYSGQFVSDIPHSIKGELTYKDGSHYRGTVINGDIRGKGMLHFIINLYNLPSIDLLHL